MSLLLADLNVNNNSSSIITFGNRMDVCYLTMRELIERKRIDRIQAEQELKGKLEGKKIVKFLYNGSAIVICMEMIHRIAEAFPVKEEALIESETSN